MKGEEGFIFCFPCSKRPRRANESFRPPFSKGGGFQRQSLWARPAGRETPSRSQSAGEAPNVPVGRLAGENPRRGFSHAAIAAFLLCPPFYSAFATNSYSMKLGNLFFCAPAARAPTFPCVEKWAKDAKEGVFRLPPSLHLPRNDQREFPLWNSPPPHALRCFGAFSNLSSFCIRLQSLSAFAGALPGKDYKISLFVIVIILTFAPFSFGSSYCIMIIK